MPSHRIVSASLAAMTALMLGNTALGSAETSHSSQQKPVCLRLAQADPKPAQDKIHEDELVREVASLLQACSYDGAPIKVDTGKLNFSATGDGRKVVSEIMKFTGLPQNFTVIEGDVPNAAAIILVDKQDQLPKRVIAYNPNFIKIVQKATQNNNWAPISIMAHEIGHHLSGHTLMPGGSQPPIELEADKFSGFVLHKMGATLGDAQKAIQTLVPEQDGATHPGRARRQSAIKEGWQQSCQQQSDKCEEIVVAERSGAPTATRTPSSAPSSSAMIEKQKTPEAKQAAPASKKSEQKIAAVSATDRLPTPDEAAIPVKFNKFVIDEAGLLDEDFKKAFAEKHFEFANKTGFEIVLIVTNSLHGRNEDAYAYDMMRQLRVGKMDVGNGVVLLLAPNEKKAGIAMGGGLLGSDNLIVTMFKEQLQAYLDGYDVSRDFAKGFNIILDTLSDDIIRTTRNHSWTVSFQSFDDLMKAGDIYKATLQSEKKVWDIKDDPTWQRIAMIEGTVKKINPPGPEMYKSFDGNSVEVELADGRTTTIHVARRVNELMPVRLEEGKKFAFIARTIKGVSFTKPHEISFRMISFSAL